MASEASSDNQACQNIRNPGAPYSIEVDIHMASPDKRLPMGLGHLFHLDVAPSLVEDL